MHYKSMKLIGYIRVSTENQKNDGYGLAVQESAIRKYAENQGMELVKIFRDEGVSGTLQNRPALIELMDYARKNKREYITLTFLRLDRLARSLLVQENLIADFQKAGLSVVSIDEPDLCSDDPTRKLFRQMKGMLAEYEKSMITLRLSAGRLKKVEMGKGYAGGNVAYGFRAKAGKYEKVPNELNVVKNIFKMRRKPKAGKRLSYERIARHLNSEAIKPPRGNEWYAMTVRLIFLNRFYKGYQEYGAISNFHSKIKVV